MTTPFHHTSTVELPIGIVHFLAPSDLSQFSRINRTMHHRAEEELKKRKEEFVNRLINYFYCIISYSDGSHKTISIRIQYTDDYYQNVRRLFYFLPELFAFIETHQITDIDLGCVNSYGGYPESPYRMISPDCIELRRIGKQLLALLSQNTTIRSCNLGLFQDLLSRKSIIHAVENHPTLDTLHMVSNGARTDFRALPQTLWRNILDRSFYWNHFRQNDSIN